MDNVQFIILAALSAVSLGLIALLFAKVRTINYLLEQPVVKKMSPQLKLKPVKVDELDESRSAPARNNANGSAPAAPARGPRPGFEGGERPPRDQSRDGNRDRAPRSDRPEGEGRFDRAPRGDRGERFGGREGGRDRDRGGRGGHDRHERGGERGDRFGGREGGREGGRDRNREPFNGGEAAPVDAARPAPAAAEAAPAQPAALSPRRPLPSTVDQDTGVKDTSADALAPNPTSAEDALFVRDDSDIQHGRRHQPKKKPRFDVAEEEVKEETKAL